uniref:Chitin-binding type-2 domain-containing protein n=1 Tax=Timema douglasi TaxID=61478 RepID=A0A7R8ZET4_TIMDO|nr:unnamed protein product [Timema douglasi]
MVLKLIVLSQQPMAPSRTRGANIEQGCPLACLYFSPGDSFSLTATPLTGRESIYDGDTNVSTTSLPSTSAVCHQAGYNCSEDCSSIQFCYEVSSGLFETITLETCLNDTLCDSRTHTCTPEGGTTCKKPRPDDYSFTCQTSGTFPDPFDCTKYYVCYVNSTENGEAIIDGTCPGGSAFDVLTLSCALPNTDRVCTDLPVPSCNSTPGIIGVLERNPSIYYICTKKDDSTFPELFRCDVGYFDVSLGECRLSSGPETTAVVPTTTKSSVLTCVEPGIFPDPDSCISFYVCPVNLQGYTTNCLSGMYFDPDTISCELGVPGLVEVSPNSANQHAGVPGLVEVSPNSANQHAGVPGVPDLVEVSPNSANQHAGVPGLVELSPDSANKHVPNTQECRGWLK